MVGLTMVSNDPRDLTDAEIMVGVDVSAYGTSADTVLLVSNVVNALMRAGAINGKFACVFRSELPEAGSLADKFCSMAESSEMRFCLDPVVIAIHAVDRRDFRSSGDEAAFAARKNAMASAVME